MNDTHAPVAADDVLAVVTGADGAVIIAVHDRARRSLDIICSEHMIADKGTFSFCYSRGITASGLDWYLNEIVHAATRHAAKRHTWRVAAQSGGDLR